MSSLFYSLLQVFESPSGYLVEIARATHDCPNTWVNEWIWLEQRHAITLQPVEDGEGFAFEEGNLYLDHPQGELRWSNGRLERLWRRNTQALPLPARGLLELHLN